MNPAKGSEIAVATTSAFSAKRKHLNAVDRVASVEIVHEANGTLIETWHGFVMDKADAVIL
ncbi:hypothetical protein HK100_005383, partial [Physocladia obscura]